MTAPFADWLLRLRARLLFLGCNERGTALVEFALVAPILFALLIGLLDFGQALNYYNQQTQLVGLGARSAAVSRCPNGGVIGTDCTSIQNQLATQYATGGLHDNTTVCIPAVAQPGKPVTVTASYRFNLIPIPGVGSITEITLTASQSERQEATPSYASGCS